MSDITDANDLQAAADRVTYDLSFRRSDHPRRFTTEGLSGDDIDDAFGDGNKSNGAWDMPDWSYSPNEKDWILQFFKVAVVEAVHEVCEWFRVDEQLLVDAHGLDEGLTIKLAEQLAETLYEQRRTNR